MNDFSEESLRLFYLAFKGAMLEGKGEWRKYLNKDDQKAMIELYYRIEKQILSLPYPGSDLT